MSKRVLVVDDEQTIAELIETLLEAEGYEMLLARNGQDALKLLPAEHIDLILSDIMMPFMDGWQLCQELSINPSLHHIKLVLMSAGNPVQPEPPLKCNYVDFVRKPVSVHGVAKRAGAEVLNQAACKHSVR